MYPHIIISWQAPVFETDVRQGISADGSIFLAQQKRTLRHGQDCRHETFSKFCGWISCIDPFNIVLTITTILQTNRNKQRSTFLWLSAHYASWRRRYISLSPSNIGRRFLWSKGRASEAPPTVLGMVCVLCLKKLGANFSKDGTHDSLSNWGDEWCNDVWQGSFSNACPPPSPTVEWIAYPRKYVIDSLHGLFCNFPTAGALGDAWSLPCVELLILTHSG